MFKNAWFAKFADKNGITDAELKEAAKAVEGGAAKNLGGGVWKARVAREGEGKSGGFRVIVFFKGGDRLFFQYAFAKSARDNIDEGELRHLKKRAKTTLSLTASQLEDHLKKREWIEVH